MSAARVTSAEAAIASARARVRVAEEALENTNVRAPFDGVVIKKRAEVGETVVAVRRAGQASREGGAIATIADLGELEVQTEVSENSVAELTAAMPAEVKLKAYQTTRSTRAACDRSFRPPIARRRSSKSASRSLNADVHVKPEMTASVTFQEARKADARQQLRQRRGADRADSKANAHGAGTALRRCGSSAAANRAGRSVVLGRERLDQVEVQSGVVPGRGSGPESTAGADRPRSRSPEGEVGHGADRAARGHQVRTNAMRSKSRSSIGSRSPSTPATSWG